MTARALASVSRHAALVRVRARILGFIAITSDLLAAAELLQKPAERDSYKRARRLLEQASEELAAPIAGDGG